MMSQIIDTHPHIIADDDEKYPRAPIGGKQSDWARHRPVTFEDYIVAMDEAGVDKAAIVQASTCYGYDNTYLADSISKLPGRVTGVACVDVVALDAVARIRHWADRGIAGLRLYTGGSKMAFDVGWLDDPGSFPSWEVAGELGLPICVQTRPVGLPKVDALARRFPQTRILIDHLARTDISDGPPYKAADALFGLAEQRNVYLKVTPRTFDLIESGAASPETFFPKLVQVFGSDRIAFGSNYPSSGGSLAEIVSRARSMLSVLAESDQHNIFARTAQRLYPALSD